MHVWPSISGNIFQRDLHCTVNTLTRLGARSLLRKWDADMLLRASGTAFSGRGSTAPVTLRDCWGGPCSSAFSYVTHGKGRARAKLCIQGADIDAKSLSHHTA